MRQVEVGWTGDCVLHTLWSLKLNWMGLTAFIRNRCPIHWSRSRCWSAFARDGNSVQVDKCLFSSKHPRSLSSMTLCPIISQQRHVAICHTDHFLLNFVIQSSEESCHCLTQVCCFVFMIDRKLLSNDNAMGIRYPKAICTPMMNTTWEPYRWRWLGASSSYRKRGCACQLLCMQIGMECTWHLTSSCPRNMCICKYLPTQASLAIPLSRRSVDNISVQLLTKQFTCPLSVAKFNDIMRRSLAEINVEHVGSDAQICGLVKPCCSRCKPWI